jgi:uncharacterized coiled-coil DUF342 family protein
MDLTKALFDAGKARDEAAGMAELFKTAIETEKKIIEGNKKLAEMVKQADDTEGKIKKLEERRETVKKAFDGEEKRYIDERNRINSELAGIRTKSAEEISNAKKSTEGEVARIKAELVKMSKTKADLEEDIAILKSTVTKVNAKVSEYC